MLTAIEIRGHTFRKSLRGFDKEEVGTFLSTVSLEWEKMVEENRRLKIDLEKTQSSLDNLKKVETVLHKTLLQAEETSKSTIENAKKDAELKVQEAEAKSKELIQNALTEKSRVEIQINELINRRNEILQQLKSYLQGQTERLKTFEEQEMKAAQLEKQKEAEGKSFFDSSMDGSGDSQIIDDIVDEL